ncbi:hypothetical protein F383_27354 [Gossypium arboreum]|uniref:Uncharacterized protein n=1 Tax=Gossypium arboreum TaxID=29729 RepID=A0A0B0PC67_GOSAR|nr:hypothetical protein F383_27354 [Gossypium arboreum]
MLIIYHPHNILKCKILFFVIGWCLIMVLTVTSVTSHCESLKNTTLKRKIKQTLPYALGNKIKF